MENLEKGQKLYVYDKKKKVSLENYDWGAKSRYLWKHFRPSKFTQVQVEGSAFEKYCVKNMLKSK